MEQEPKKPQKKKDNEPDLEKMIEELKENIEKKAGKVNFEIVRIKANPITLKTRLYFFLINLGLNFIVITSISGYIKWFESQTIFHYGVFFIVFSIFEELLKMIILQIVPAKIISLSFGSIIWLSTVIAFVLSAIFMPGFKLIDSNATVVLFFAFMIIRAFLNNLLTKYRLKKQIMKARDSNENISKGE